MVFLRLLLLSFLLYGCSFQKQDMTEVIHKHYIGQGALDKYSKVLNAGEQKVFNQNIELSKDIAYLLQGNILYIKLFYFHRQSMQNIEQYISNYPQSKGMILDLRNNTGGLLEQAINIVDLFIEKDETLLHISNGKDNDIYYAKKKASYKRPVVVLVNNKSMSASEIVAGILQEKQRAIIIGQITYGKGSIQDIIQKNSQSAKVTTGYYSLPSGTNIENVGIIPNIEIKHNKITKVKNISQDMRRKLNKVKMQNKDVNLIVAQRFLTI
ncbi:MAG: Carboxyl-terminal protease [uncultured Sulfurovum sp.]|uniref:Carboxyl-terminal protease n=1 Tax=uncultured Sulfurovum sp. TaxID=269237 RepID=A0A6S6SLL2_9BACT|nr:MAG: Carboxyl-terminal protease [uncultured Sulfurovum sp.]